MPFKIYTPRSILKLGLQGPKLKGLKFKHLVALGFYIPENVENVENVGSVAISREQLSPKKHLL